MAYGLSNSHVTDDVTWSQRCWSLEAVRSSILATAWLLVAFLRVTACYSAYIICYRPSVRHTGESYKNSWS